MDASEAAPYTVADSFLVKTPCFHSLSPNSVRESNRKEISSKPGRDCASYRSLVGKPTDSVNRKRKIQIEPFPYEKFTILCLVRHLY